MNPKEIVFRIWENQRKEEDPLIRNVNNVIAYTLKHTKPYVGYIIQEKIGMTTSRDTRGREHEDEETLFDKLAEEHICLILDDATKKFQIPLKIYSEHLEEPYTTGSRGPYYTVALDPVDNSAQHKSEVDKFFTPPWTVFSVYDLNGDPLGAGAINYGSKEVFINRNGKNYFHDPNDLKFKNDIPFPSISFKKRSIRDNDIYLAAYLDKPKYKLIFDENFGQLVKDMKSYYDQDDKYKGQIGSMGGNFIYVPTGLGQVHEYIAAIEPLEEAMPGMPFLLSAGGEIRLISPDGRSYQKLSKFDPDLMKQRAVLLLASLFPELMDETMSYFSLGKEPMKKRRNQTIYLAKAS